MSMSPVEPPIPPAIMACQSEMLDLFLIGYQQMIWRDFLVSLVEGQDEQSFVSPPPP